MKIFPQTTKGLSIMVAIGLIVVTAVIISEIRGKSIFRLKPAATEA
jgi:hypothetical protein